MTCSGTSPSLPQLRLIVIALLGGQLLFVGVLAFLFLGSNWTGLGEPIPILETIGLVIGIVAIPMSYVARGAFWRSLPDLEGNEQMAAFARGTLIFHAFLEGAVLLNLVAVMVNGNPIPNSLVAGAVFAVGVANLPSEHQLKGR